MPRATKGGPGKRIKARSSHCDDLKAIRDAKAEALVDAHAALGTAEGNLTIAQTEYEIAEMNYQQCLGGG